MASGLLELPQHSLMYGGLSGSLPMVGVGSQGRTGAHGNVESGHRGGPSANSMIAPGSSLGANPGAGLGSGFVGGPSRHSTSPGHRLAYTQSLCDSISKVVTPQQMAVVVSVPHAVIWVSGREQRLLSSMVGSTEDIYQALLQKMDTQAAMAVAQSLWRSIEDLAGCMNGGQTDGGAPIIHNGRQYRVDLDCYADDEPDQPLIRTAVALLSPLSDDHDLTYEQAQLSAIRYSSGVSRVESGEPANTPLNDMVAHGRNRMGYAVSQDQPQTELGPILHTRGTSGESSPSESEIGDFIPSMTTTEVAYFYSMLSPNPERYPEEVLSVLATEQRVKDPDDHDPYRRLRQSFSVLPRQPRNPLEVEAELAKATQFADQAAARAAVQAQSDPQGGDKMKCFECGVEHSPEWRRGPFGPKTLCNRCGLRYAKKMRTRH